MSKHEISNSDDVIDSRDVIERIDELKDEIEALEGDDFDGSKVGGPDDPVDADLRDELAKLEALADEAEDYCEDWKHGAALYRDSYFVEAMQEMLEDCGDLPKNLPAYIEIDWDKTADNLKVDYTSVDYDGVTYWVR